MQAFGRVGITGREALGQSGRHWRQAPRFYQTVVQTTHASCRGQGCRIEASTETAGGGLEEACRP
jgi:hypothetical protein